MTQPAAVINLVDRARRRRLGNLLLEQILIAATVFLGALCLLLVVGTAVLNWYWPAGLGIAALAILAFRFRQRIPESYEMAQSLDESLGSRDLLSTAWHFGQTPVEQRPVSRFLDMVTAEAEVEAGRISAEDAVPLKVPKVAWVVAGLIALGAALLLIRFGVLNTLDLRASLVPVQFDTLTGLPQQVAQKQNRPGLPQGQVPQPMALSEDGTDQKREEAPIPEDALQSVDVPDINQTTMNAQQTEKKREGLSSGKEGEEGGESSEQGEPGDNPGAKEDNNAPSGDPKSSQGAKEKNQGPKEANSLLDKMRDAFANLMDKMNIQPRGDEGQQKSGGESKQQASNSQKMDQKGMPGQSKSPSKGETDAEAKADQMGESADQAQGNKASQGEKAEQPSSEARSGMGKQDGNKDTELAEQLEAMGKISEILGKRSANLNGEMMVEVQNSKQQPLRTPYQNRKATHGEAGAEINRDEVPLHLHQFVQQYYDQVRKTAPAAASTPPAAPTKQ